MGEQRNLQISNLAENSVNYSWKRNDGTVLQGEYSPDGDDYKRPYAEGFKSNCIYFKLGFLNKTSIAVGRQFCELLPLLWLKAGAHNPCPVLPEGSDLPDLLVLPETVSPRCSVKQPSLNFQPR